MKMRYIVHSLSIMLIICAHISCKSQNKNGGSEPSAMELTENSDGDKRSDPIGISIKPEDSVMSTTDVNILMSIVNNDTTDIVLYYSLSFESIAAAMGAFLFFEIIHESGEHLVFDLIAPRPKMPHRNDTLVLRPRETYQETINLTEFYIDSARVGHSEEEIWPKRHWIPGSYSIQCTYEYIHNPNWIGGRDLWEGEATSNRINIVVK